MMDFLFERRSARACRSCGCTEDDCSGCIERTGMPCHWKGPLLCSACPPPKVRLVARKES